MSITWHPDFEVKVEKIDEQHKKLVSILNKLFDAMVHEKGRSVLSEILKDLTDYTKYHFETEESMMALYDYPEILQHKQYHEELTKKVIEFQIKFCKGDDRVTRQLYDFLKKWLMQHILNEDKKLKPYFEVQIQK